MMTIRFKKGRIPFEKLHSTYWVFHSTPETKLRIIKMGDETQYHLEHVRKMKLD